MKITVLFPVPAHNPLGGAKVVYEYANGLAARGHKVSVMHTLAPSIVDRGVLISAATYVGRAFGLKGGVGPKRWMAVDPSVKIGWVPSHHQRWIPTADVVVATSWHTAEFACNYQESQGRKYYFIQDFEFFMSAPPNIKSRMAATYRSGFKNVVISPACEMMVRECGGEVFARVPNGLDHRQFRLTTSIESNERNSIGFPVRKESFKRTHDAIAACEAIRATSMGKNLQFWGFGATRPQYWPEWMTFAKRPTDDELTALYNRSSIFLVPSEYEGWGLPGSEAMCCGAALVSTRNGGVDAYAEHGRNALLVKPGDIDAMTSSALQLLREPSYRFQIAAEAAQHIRRFTWESSVDQMEACLGGTD